MIGKLLDYIEAVPFIIYYWYQRTLIFLKIVKVKKSKPVRLQPHKYKDPLYPPDLAEMFPENRTEDHTDNCLWQTLEEDDKP